jgi:pantoate--beta-alanine ligase
MIVFNTIAELTSKLDDLRRLGNSIGFVPTMGALHAGHLSLIDCAGNENDIVITSIFVNPTQFNNPIDLKNYPRNIETDCKLLEKTKCNFVFAPDEKEIYPDDSIKNTKFDFGNLASVMEGAYRPGHFDGVATVVKRLFELIKPNKAYFGQKDIQQFLIVNSLNTNYLNHLGIALVKCPIIRENDGLALSSRNVLLSPFQRKSAGLISQSLFAAQKEYRNYQPKEIKKLITNKINSDPNLKVEYIELVNDPDLKIIDKWDDSSKILACIAVQVGNVRLIDNIYFN